MRSDDSSFSHLLEALKELLHSLRTPLGVALTIAKDGKNNLPLSSKDHDDAIQALEKIRGSFDELRPILNLDRLEWVTLNLEELSAICEVEGMEFAPSEEVNCKYQLDTNLLRIWLSTCRKLSGRTVNAIFTTEYASLTVQVNTELKVFSQSFFQLLVAAFSSIGGHFEIMPGESTVILPAYNSDNPTLVDSPRGLLRIVRKENFLLK